MDASRRDAGDAGTSSRSGDAADGPPPPQSTHVFKLDTTLVWCLANSYAFFGTLEARLLRRRSSTMTPHRLRRVGSPSSLHRVE
jgi:hypothetical protein